MNRRRRFLLAGGGAVCLFVLVQLGALALVEPFQAEGYQQIENPGDPTNSVVYLVLLLVVTGAMLAVIRLGADRVLRGFIVLASASISWYVFSIVANPVAAIVGLPSAGLAVGGAAAVALALIVHPEWYVIAVAGVLMGSGAGGLFGISFGVLPAIVLLTALAVYDAISVYGTEHMLTLASGVMAMKVPVVFVIPLSRSYSFLAEGGDGDDETSEAGDPDAGGERATAPDPEDRDVIFVGLGDAVMPTVLVASAAFFLDTPSLGVPGLALTLPALTAMCGTIAGLLVLIHFVLKGRAHAGLPLLNGGAIGGYLVGALAAGVPLVEALGLGPYL